MTPRVYQGGRPVDDERTMDIRHDPTPLFGLMAVGQQSLAPAPRPTDQLKTVLMVAGAVFLVLVLCLLGGWLVSATMCPCTFGQSDQPAAAPSFVVHTEPAAWSGPCLTEDGTP